MSIDPVDWATLHGHPLVAVADCWRRCNGLCCSNAHPDLQFRLLPPGGSGTVVAYLEDEYQWMKAAGHVICGEENGTEIQPFRFEFGGPCPLVFRHAPCRHLGRCPGACVKPLLCRSYPYIPVIGLEGTVEDLVPASIIDAAFRVKEGRAFCPLEDDPGPNPIHAALAADPLLAKALAHPRLILYTQAAGAFARSFSTRMRAFEGFAGLSGTAFWQAWEMAYLRRQLVDREAIAAHVLRVHDALAARFGDFL